MQKYPSFSKILMSVILLFASHFLQAQEFPKQWEGEWEGTLRIFDSKSLQPTTSLQMKLEIQPIKDSIWSWKIQYVNAQPEKTDVRAYELHQTKNPSKWMIDEKNGIQLTQTFIGNRLSSSFSLDKTLLLASYWFENNALQFEIVVTHFEIETLTGLGETTSPFVGNHAISSYHRATLNKVR